MTGMTIVIVGLAAALALVHALQLVAVAWAGVEGRRQRRLDRAALRAAAVGSGELPGISAVVHATNGAAAVSPALDALLAAHYPALEILVVLDSSSGDLLDALSERFDLEPADPRPRGGIPTQHMRAVFAARGEARLIVVDKRGADRADAWNAALNVASEPLLLTLAPGVVPDRDALVEAALPFALDASVLATIGVVRPADDAGRRGADVPAAAAGGVEYLEAARRVCASLASNLLNAQVHADSGFALYARRALIRAGGFHPHVAEPGLEMATRLHVLWRDAREPYRILQSAAALARRPAPSGWRDLAAGRWRSYQGSAVLLALHGRTMASRRAGPLAALVLPATIGRVALPIAETTGWIAVAGGLVSGAISLDTAALFAAATAGLGLAVTLAALLVQVVSLAPLPSAVATLRLAGLAVLEQLGPRQILQLRQLRFWLNPAKSARLA